MSFLDGESRPNRSGVSYRIAQVCRPQGGPIAQVCRSRPSRPLRCVAGDHSGVSSGIAQVCRRGLPGSLRCVVAKRIPIAQVCRRRNRPITQVCRRCGPPIAQVCRREKPPNRSGVSSGPEVKWAKTHGSPGERQRRPSRCGGQSLRCVVDGFVAWKVDHCPVSRRSGGTRDAVEGTARGPAGGGFAAMRRLHNWPSVGRSDDDGSCTWVRCSTHLAAPGWGCLRGVLCTAQQANADFMHFLGSPPVDIHVKALEPSG